MDSPLDAPFRFDRRAFLAGAVGTAALAGAPLAPARAQLRIDITRGQVQDVRIERTAGTPPEPLRAFAEGARRATLRSSPLPLPPGRGAQLTGGNLILTFTAKEMLGIRG